MCVVDRGELPLIIQHRPASRRQRQRSRAGRPLAMESMSHLTGQSITQFLPDGQEMGVPLVEQSYLRCYEHGCEGRTFTRIENYKRHLREMNGIGTVSCPFCYKSFTRKSNMDKHILEGKCGVIKAALITCQSSQSWVSN
jgi:hypothetical protein